MFLEPKGRNWGPIVNWDDLGKAYAVLIVTWTVVLTFGVAWLIHNRHLPFIRVRNLPLAITSTTFLHLYLIKICLAYTTNGHFLCSAEYWIMSVYLPFGIALFQAYLVQLRSLWEQQQILVSRSLDVRDRDCERRSKSLLQLWHDLSSSKKSYCVIGLGMVLQILTTAVLYAITPTLQGDWSSYGPIPHAKGQALCRKSLPWIPSAFWQLFWSWFYGPYTLFKVRKIHDIHFWRAQVAISVLSGMPGSPLWLAALYSQEFKPVNIRFVPPMWLAPGIMVMQFVTVFFPVYEGWQSRKEMRQTLSLLHAWEDHSQGPNSDQSTLVGLTAKSSIDGSISSPSANSPHAQTRVNTMAALRKALVVNPAPLLDFAATKDFTAENILFLIRVREWRSAWSTAPRTGLEPTPLSLTHLFNMAVDIYVMLINDRTAEFPINIEGKIRARLDTLFESAVPEHGQIRYLPSPSVLSASAQAHTQQMATMQVDSSNLGKTLWDTSSTIVTIKPIFESHPCVEPVGKTRAIVRPGFGEDVFDDAERSIEYLVLTNTWQKFVRYRAAVRTEDVLV